MTSVLDGGEWSASRPGRALPPAKGPPVPIGQEAGWASELVWTQRLEEKSLQQLVSDIIFTSKTCYGSEVSSTCALVRKAADEIRIMIFQILRMKEINELVVTSNKLTNHFAVCLQVVSGRQLAYDIQCIEMSLGLFDFKEQLLIKANISYLTYKTSVSSHTNHVLQMSSSRPRWSS
jgi:hypothetical protein